jgi:hypothetical protein
MTAMSGGLDQHCLIRRSDTIGRIIAPIGDQGFDRTPDRFVGTFLLIAKPLRAPRQEFYTGDNSVSPGLSVLCLPSIRFPHFCYIGY